ncbi:hypothetical protein [Nitrosomonas sp. Is37]|uniref:hypothetical protein n=1 Tax=Nitrosomonas sp. Is37 TaxID=3080535 RepID=UPI00294B375E|nr:hypothetical protein [Nitrosomonas sp. Is37]MDV6343809.1 hypothetical protein [Nitrosomonas sp. Is37]
MDRYLTTKGLFLRQATQCKYVLEDVFGNCTLPFEATTPALAFDAAYDLARVRILCHESECQEMSSFSSFKWFELEKYYVARLTDYFRYWQVGQNNVSVFDMLTHGLPTAYIDAGFGEGTRDELEKVDKFVNAKAEFGVLPFTNQYLAIKLSHVQLRRICSDLMSLIHRAITAFVELLKIQRKTIMEECWSAEHMGVPEIVHTGPKSYRTATSVTICVISLCSSLDISSKLIHFLNSCASPIVRFRGAQGKHYSDLQKMRPISLPENLVKGIVERITREKEFHSLIQLRHDIVHSTTALEMEKIYVGNKTGEVNELPLCYSFMPWRDCLESGQPLRYLGRDYFVGYGMDIEWQLLNWIRAVIDYHLFVGAALYGFLTSNLAEDTGVQLVGQLDP